MLTIGSLFSGIGGLELGLERAGLGPVLWQAEQDPYCQRVLAKHWPVAKRYDDVRDIDGRAERVDLICGGFPCQDISNAGKRAGMAGERSGLWREYARIIRELRPRFVVVENVSALLGRGFGDVLGDLAACGYDLQWDCVPAAAVGAPHRRDRVFVVAWRVPDTERDRVREEPGGRGGCGDGTSEAEPGNVGPAVVHPDGQRLEGRCGNLGDSPGRGQPAHADQALADAEVSRRSRRVEQIRDGSPIPGTRGDGQDCGYMADGDGVGRQSQRGSEVQHGEWSSLGDHVDRRDLPQWPPAPDDMHAWGRVQASAQPAFCRISHGVPDRAHRLRALGNAVVPQVAEVIGRVIVGMA